MQAHAIVDFERSEVERSNQLDLVADVLPRVNRRDLEPEHELRRVFCPQHQAAPQLVARQGVEQRHQRVVDLYQMFVPHSPILPEAGTPLTPFAPGGRFSISIYGLWRVSMLIRTLAVAASVLALTACSTPAAAIGSMVDINVIDRVTGETLPMYWHDGRWWVPGKPGNRYAVSLTNRSGGRTLNVISVDGVNVVSGETAAHDQTGYVLNSGQFAQITGWRKNLARVAAFEFTALPNSYAARTGRPDNVGVIGVAVFREKVRYVPPPETVSPPLSRSKSESRARFGA